MKNSGARRRLLLFAILTLTIAQSCRKDDEPAGPLRVSFVESYLDQIRASATQIIYSDNKVAEMQGEYYYTNGSLAYETLTEASYSEDSILVTDYYDNYGSWEMESMDLFEMEGDKVLRRSLAIGGLTAFRHVYEYFYTGDRLDEVIFYTYNNPETRTVYEYSGPDLANKFIYTYENDSWRLTGHDTLYYHGDGLDSMVCYRIDGPLKYRDRKYIYQFQDTLMIQLVLFQSYDSLSWSLHGRYDFEYDLQGNLISKSSTIGGGVYREEYSYEPGEGNYWLVTSLP